METHVLYLINDKSEAEWPIAFQSEPVFKQNYFLLFSPHEYENNLETLIGMPFDEQVVSIGYTTTVHAAIHRLNRLIEQLKDHVHRLYPREDDLFMQTLMASIFTFLRHLKQENPKKLLVLKENPPLSDLVISDDGIITDVGDNWYNNRADSIRRNMKHLLDTPPNIKNILRDYADQLSNEPIPGIQAKFKNAFRGGDSWLVAEFVEYMENRYSPSYTSARSLFVLVANHCISFYKISLDKHGNMLESTQTNRFVKHILNTAFDIVSTIDKDCKTNVSI